MNIELFRHAQQAAKSLRGSSHDAHSQEVLLAVARSLRKSVEVLLGANAMDLAAMSPDDPRYDRLLLNENRIESMAKDVETVAKLVSPIGCVLHETVRPNGLKISRVSVPFGVIGMIYESRPNVTVDAFALCFRSGNACVLKGGKEAQHSNQSLVSLIHQVLERFKVNSACLTLLPSTRDATQKLLEARGWVDVLIPRGSQSLIDHVRDHARVPVIETGAGVVHIYFDAAGDLEKGRAIIDNAKTRRVSVCNALDTLLIHESRKHDLPALLAPVIQKGVEILYDSQDYSQEFLSLKMAVKVVKNLEEALDHVAQYGSGHSEAIITEDTQAAKIFMQQVDAACVYVNAPTSFTDGAQFGLGAEMGISTQKLHARGPFALEALTTYQWQIEGNGQVRNY